MCSEGYTLTLNTLQCVQSVQYSTAAFRYGRDTFDSLQLRATSLCLCLCNEDVQRRDRYLFVGGKLERGCSENVCLVFSFKVNLGNRFEHKEISLNSNAPCQRP
jgi:hypothetical protein